MGDTKDVAMVSILYSEGIQDTSRDSVVKALVTILSKLESEVKNCSLHKRASVTLITWEDGEKEGDAAKSAGVFVEAYEDAHSEYENTYPVFEQEALPNMTLVKGGDLAHGILEVQLSEIEDDLPPVDTIILPEIEEDKSYGHVEEVNTGARKCECCSKILIFKDKYVDWEDKETNMNFIFCSGACTRSIARTAIKEDSVTGGSVLEGKG